MNTKKHEIYMANASPSHWGPKATYIPLARFGPAEPLGVGIGVNANLNVRIGGYANFSVFRYQHVGLSQREDPTQMVLRCSGI